jgi:hypothetical protein
MADRKRYPPLFLDDRHRDSSRYTRQPTKRDDDKKTVRDRPSHAEKIQRGLRKAWKEAEESRQAVGTTTSHGVYLEFEIDLNSQLPITTLDPRSKGVELRNVRVVGEGEEKRQLATVFVPLEQRSYFVRLAKDYADDEKDTDKRNPKNQKFIESVDDIRSAVLESFWTHDRRELPGDDPQWVEIWLQDPAPELVVDGESISPVIREFRALLPDLQIEEQADHAILKFPERAVVLIRANREQLSRLAAVSDTLAEIRPAAELASFFIDELTGEEQAEFISNLVDRMRIEADLEIAVCILDGGVNRGHPILEKVLEEDDCHSVKPEWGASDHREDGHGTMMAGIAALGDVQKAVESGSSIEIDHCLESSKLLPPPPDANPKRLWGDYTSQAISRAEIKPRRARVIVMAVSSLEDMDRGRPSSWSGKVDQIVSGAEDEIRRLFVVASGNTKEQGLLQNYPSGLLASSVHNPAQAWNALSIGGYTKKVDFDEPNKKCERLAESGEASPFTTTSECWDKSRWPIKPEIVFEAGNAIRDQYNFVGSHDDLSLLTTEARFHDYGYFCAFAGTSAASAYVAWMAARIHVAYPDLWPETVRALLVHSAEWTPEMKKQFLYGEGKTDYAKLARVFGYGVPHLEKALSCPSNSLTLISEANIQPFGLSDDERRKVSNEMHLYELPWPKADLLGLGETNVRMRITLSYYVEPSPGEVGWRDRYRYASHGLRFELNRPGEERKRFEKRVNRKALEEGETKPKGSAADFWTIGSARDTGSIHSDLWTGSAADLADSNLVAIYPVNGWWKERHHLGKWNKSTRYSLIVSIETPDEEIDIYTPVAAQIGIATPVPVEIEIGT